MQPTTKLKLIEHSPVLYSTEPKGSYVQPQINSTHRTTPSDTSVAVRYQFSLTQQALRSCKHLAIMYHPLDEANMVHVDTAIRKQLDKLKR